jgi:hypothetical protein
MIVHPFRSDYLFSLSNWRRLSIALIVTVAAVITACSSEPDAVKTVESKHRTPANWSAFDGMSPAQTAVGNYFPDTFMPVSEHEGEGAFKVLGNGEAAPIFYSDKDATVVKIAAEAFADDVERVSGLIPVVSSGEPSGRAAILIGTLGDSPLIDQLVTAGKVDVSAIEGKWEAYHASVVETPIEGLAQALVIIGSDRRGTAYGVFALSESMGVSPWHFWGDVPSKSRSAVYVSGSHTQSSPAVKYRGIFINDEDWGFQPWAANTFEPEVGNIGPRTYATVFELLLRLNANMIWPAMHEFPVESTPFYLHPDNKVVADNYAIVISTSHHEPMLRNSHEYKPEKQGPYDYWQNRDTLYKFWEERVVETADYENIYTIGMRGRDDSGMKAPEGTTNEGKAAKIQNSIIPDQRQMIRDHVHSDPSEIPQIFIPYKETLVQYQSGLQLEDDITIVWPDDNHGFIRQLSTEQERARSGGTGVYYHLQYWGVPRSYLWLHSTPLGMTRAEMLKAWDFESRKIWIVNVGDIKPYEIGTEFFLRMAQNPELFREFNQHEYLKQWATHTFGSEQSTVIASVYDDYLSLNIVKRPEHIDRVESGFSFVENGDEAAARQLAFLDLVARADAIYEGLDEAQKAAFYGMILYPVRASNYANQRVLSAERSRLWAEQGRAATDSMAAQAMAAQQALKQETRFYNEQNAGGKWNYMLSEMPTSELPRWAYETQNAWAMPEVGQYDAGEAAGLGVAIEGRADAIEPGDAVSLPVFNRLAGSEFFIDVFNKGKTQINWTLKSSAAWLKLSETSGTEDARITVSIDWPKAPLGEAIGANISIVSATAEYSITVKANNPADIDQNALPKAIENNRKVEFEAEHFLTRADATDGSGWRLLDSAAASGDGMTVFPVTTASRDLAALDSTSPSLSYEFYAITSGPIEVHTQALPTHRITSEHDGLRYAISLNGAAPQIIDLNAIEYSDAWNANTLRAASIGVSEHTISDPGVQTLKIWMVDAGVVLDKFKVQSR